MVCLIAQYKKQQAWGLIQMCITDIERTSWNL